MSREAMKLALDALVFAQYEDRDYDDVCDQKVREARNALRQALETDQEPVAWASSLDFDDDDQEIIPAKDKGKYRDWKQSHSKSNGTLMRMALW